jgi:hypothetical protein
MQLYYESHITLDPVTVSEQVEQVEKLCKEHNFQLAKFAMVKSFPVNTNDTFATGRGEGLDKLAVSMLELIYALKEAGFVVRRYKIEAVVIDSRILDSYGVL